MKTTLYSLLALFMLVPAFAHSAYYQWTDTKGVLHLTDDADKVPGEYRGKVKRVEVQDLPAKSAAPAREARPKSPAARRLEPGGHDERWWRRSFSTLNNELKALQESRKGKEQRLVELRRERRVFHRGRDRAAVNAMEAEVAADDQRIAEAMNRLTALEQDASRAGVPAEWRR